MKDQYHRVGENQESDDINKNSRNREIFRAMINRNSLGKSNSDWLGGSSKNLDFCILNEVWYLWKTLFAEKRNKSLSTYIATISGNLVTFLQTVGKICA